MHALVIQLSKADVQFAVCAFETRDLQRRQFCRYQQQVCSCHCFLTKHCTLPEALNGHPYVVIS